MASSRFPTTTYQDSATNMNGNSNNKNTSDNNMDNHYYNNPIAYSNLTTTNNTSDMPSDIDNSTHSLNESNEQHSMMRASLSDTSSFKQQKKTYELKKKYFTKNIYNAIETTTEVHSGWLKARTAFKRWTKVWCQVKPGYLILYSSQEAQKKHRLGVVLISICQAIQRPSKKEGFCFKMINPFGCSVWAKSSTRAFTFPQTSLMLRASDKIIGKLWLEALQKSNLSSNLDSSRIPASDREIDFSDSDDANSTSNRNLTSLANMSNISNNNNNNNNNNHHHVQKNNYHSNSSSNNHSMSSMNGTPRGNLSGTSRTHQWADLNSQKRDLTKYNFSNNNSNFNCNPSGYEQDPLSSPMSHRGSSLKRDVLPAHDNSNFYRSSSSQNLTTRFAPTANNGVRDLDATISAAHTSAAPSNKMVAKLNKYNWRELQLESVTYYEDGHEENLASSGVQTEEVLEGNKNFLWHIIKQLRPGMDLSKVTLPTFILEPRSFLEKLADYYYHCDILAEASMLDDPSARLCAIVKWYLSGFYKKPKCPKKPYNPLLGERFRCFWDCPKTGSRTFFVAEQVSHHPPISAFYVTNRKDGYSISCALLSRSKFTGNSVSAILDGRARLHLNKRNETYTMTMPYANCRGILMGSLCMELGGKVEIECLQTACKCELEFKLASPVWASANSYNTLIGKLSRAGKATHTLEGHWDEKITIANKSTGERSTLWEVTDEVRATRLKRYTVHFDEQGDRESVKLWAKVTEALMASDQVAATTEKTKLEDMQRQEARERQGPHRPSCFLGQHGGSGVGHDYSYRWQDDRMWDERQDIMQFESHFRIQTLVCNPPSSSPHDNDSIDVPVSEFLAKTQGDQSNHHALSNSTQGKPREPSTSQSTSADAHNQQQIKDALEKVAIKSIELEEDVAKLKRFKRLGAILLVAMIAIVVGVFLRAPN